MAALRRRLEEAQEKLAQTASVRPPTLSVKSARSPAPTEGAREQPMTVFPSSTSFFATAKPLPSYVKMYLSCFGMGSMASGGVGS